MALNECEIKCSENKQQSIMALSLFNTFFNIKQNSNIDDIYVNFSSDKLEVYVFLNKESYEDENFISEQFTNFEKDVLYFPELFIYSNDEVEKMNVLPRKVLRIC